MHIEITIHCPELGQLAAALQAAPAAPTTAPAAPTAPEGSTTAPAAPVSPSPTPLVSPNPAPAYTLDQLMKAGADLAQAGKMEQVLALLTQYGVQAVPQLPPEQYGMFAMALRGLGAAL